MTVDNAELLAAQEAARRSANPVVMTLRIQPSAQASVEKPLRLALTAPWTTTRFVGRDARGGIISVDRDGVLCDVADANSLIKQASAVGVTLTIGLIK